MEIAVNVETLKDRFPDTFDESFEYWFRELAYRYTFSISQVSAYSSVSPFTEVHISRGVYPTYHESVKESGVFNLRNIRDFKYLVMFLLADLKLPYNIEDLLGGTHMFSPISYA